MASVPRATGTTTAASISCPPTKKAMASRWIQRTTSHTSAALARVTPAAEVLDAAEVVAVAVAADAEDEVGDARLDERLTPAVVEVLGAPRALDLVRVAAGVLAVAAQDRVLLAVGVQVA